MRKAGPSFSYEIVYGKQNEQMVGLKYIVPSEVLTGPADKIPGLFSTALPARFASFDEPQQFSERQTIYAHQIRISSLNEIE